MAYENRTLVVLWTDFHTTLVQSFKSNVNEENIIMNTALLYDLKSIIILIANVIYFRD